MRTRSLSPRESPPSEPEAAARFLLRGSVRTGASAGPGAEEEVVGVVRCRGKRWVGLGFGEFSGPGVGVGGLLNLERGVLCLVAGFLWSSSGD